MNWSALTTPPPPRPPAEKYPLFTTRFFSTKSFGPGHIVGAGILVFGIWGLVKFAVARSEAAARGTKAPQDAPRLAQMEHVRGQYGNKP